MKVYYTEHFLNQISLSSGLLRKVPDSNLGYRDMDY
jgi:hypothetical protein